MVYFDCNATTPCLPEVVEAMAPYWTERFGNPSSPYTFARSAALAVDDARRAVASLVHAEPEQIVFTSGGTESNAMALLGALPGLKPRNEVVLSAVEHASVRAWRPRLEAMGYRVHEAAVQGSGAIDLAALAALVSDRTALVSVMLANNETGVVYPLSDIAAIAHRVGALVHTDAAQAIGKMPVDLAALGVDAATGCAHKFHGPKGVGFLFLRDPSRFEPFLLGGEQEGGRRAGTEPVPLIVGLGKACEAAAAWLASGGPVELRKRRDAFEDRLSQSVEGMRVAGRGEPRLGNTTLALLDGVETEALLALLDMEGFACSSGSACSSGAHEPSHALAAMGLARGANGKPSGILRISAGRLTVGTDYDRLLAVLPDIIRRLRS